jgi:hypothetical protein
MLKATFDNDKEISKINGLNPAMSFFTGPSKVSSTTSSKGGSRKSKRTQNNSHKNKTKGQNKR